MGEIDNIHQIDNPKFLKTDFTKWKNVKVHQSTDYENLVALFYNTQDPILSDKKVRQALSYALPQEFEEGKKAYSPILPDSIYYYSAAESQIVGKDIAK